MHHSIRLPMVLLAAAVSCVTMRPAMGAPAPAGAEEQPAGIGAWTTNWPAAVKVARERKLPIFLQFTGSDWCGWCQKMEMECFSKPEFLEAMKTRCVLVVADFPQNTGQTAALKEQNNKLANQFKKRGGMPAYYMVDADAVTVHWSWGAHPKYGKDLKLLVSDIEGFVAGCACVVERVAGTLPAPHADAYRKAASAYAEKQKEVSAWLDGKHPDAQAAKTRFEAYNEELRTLRAPMQDLVPKR